MVLIPGTIFPQLNCVIILRGKWEALLELPITLIIGRGIHLSNFLNNVDLQKQGCDLLFKKNPESNIKS